MVNKLYKLIFCFTVGAFVILFSGCGNKDNYNNLLKLEQKKIDEYLKRNGYTVVTEFPADSVFEENVFYHPNDDEIYFRLISKGVGDTIRKYDKLEIRYIQSTLDEHPLVESYWSTMDLEYPIEVSYGDVGYDIYGSPNDYGNSCEGWNDAFGMMQRNGAVAEIIVPSFKGFAWAVSSTAVTPYYYKITFKVLPK